MLCPCIPNGEAEEQQTPRTEHKHGDIDHAQCCLMRVPEATSGRRTSLPLTASAVTVTYSGHGSKADVKALQAALNRGSRALKVLTSCENKQRKKARERERNKGRQKGRQEGRQKGKQEGRQKEQQEMGMMSTRFTLMLRPTRRKETYFTTVVLGAG